LSLESRQADEEHEFGHGRERFFWAFLAAVFIFLGGAVFSVGRGVFALVHGGNAG
jgi:divalent metal cation (Fe/Co/Zn/Cd) transporter